MIVSIQYKSTDPNYPMYGKFILFTDVKSVGYSDNYLFVKFNNGDDSQINLDFVSMVFIS